MTATWREERDRLRTLLEGASARPWVARDEWIDGSGYDEVLLPAQVDCMSYCYGGSSHVEYGTEHDQALIVAAVNALPGLLDALDAAEAELDGLAAAIEQVRALAAAWRYDGRYGWGPWQAGEGPDPEGETLDVAALELVRALDGGE